MPELPAVEHERRYFEETSLDKTIESVDVLDDGVLEETEAAELIEQLTGRSFDDTARRGKFMFASVAGDDWVQLHYGMSGTLEYWTGEADGAPDYTRIRIDFEDGSHLGYVCMRKLGRVARVDSPEAVVEARDLGPDVFGDDFDRETFRDLLDGKRGYLKSALMDQQSMAGLGNEHSDEILFQMGLFPKTKVTSLDDDQIDEAFELIRETVAEIVERYPDFDALPDHYLMPHRHEGGSCPACGTELETVTASGRTAYYCPSRQPED